MTAHEVLKTYYGFDHFRPLQEEIIQSVLESRDTLALLPTGGGKSICFQVPTLVMTQKEVEYRLDELGLCLVITPLIALMKDQVENLKRRNILAASLHSGMSMQEQSTIFDNCQYGPYRFLYISPERLGSTTFRERLTKLPIKLIAVDEAHCISQWGYDFRPSYLGIGEVRKELEERLQTAIPILALTATATPEVVEDIQQQLGFKQTNVLRKSFERPNLHYIVRNTDQKEQQLLHILSKVKGSAIVYVRNRKKTFQISEYINQCLAHEANYTLMADFYHAGLSSAERAYKQDEWKKGNTRIIVCTNAFGMGIDKPDVRIVIHYDLPDSIEAYFQEAGRAGRDEKTSYAVLLYNADDKKNVMKRVSNTYPSKEIIENVYHKTCDFFVVGAGSGLGHSFILHIDELCQRMHLPILQTYSSFSLLKQAGYIDFQEEQEIQARVQIRISPHEMSSYSFTREQEELLNRLMRKYTGIFTDLQYLHEDWTVNEEKRNHELLVSLAKRGVITYIPHTTACTFTLTKERQVDIYIPSHIYEKRAEHFKTQLHAMVEYAEQTQFCRSQVLLSYFGEINAPICGGCDVCIHQKQIH